jgi:hypothetical protein
MTEEEEKDGRREINCLTASNPPRDLLNTIYRDLYALWR